VHGTRRNASVDELIGDRLPEVEVRPAPPTRDEPASHLTGGEVCFERVPHILSYLVAAGTDARTNRGDQITRA
jgi:hypothetical protein